MRLLCIPVCGPKAQKSASKTQTRQQLYVPNRRACCLVCAVLHTALSGFKGHFGSFAKQCFSVHDEQHMRHAVQGATLSAVKLQYHVSRCSHPAGSCDSAQGPAGRHVTPHASAACKDSAPTR